MYGEPQRQMTSTWLNIAGAGLVSGGCVSQLAAIASGASMPFCAVLALSCIASGIALHMAALRLTKPSPQDRSGRVDDPAS